MNILFLHQNFPGQFRHVAQAFAADGTNVLRAITDAVNEQPDLVPTRRYVSKDNVVRGEHPLAAHFASRVARGEVVAQEMIAVRDQGFRPDIVIGHPGWGETLFVKDVWPDTRLIVHAEFFYSADGADADFDPEFADSAFERRLQIRMRNAAMLTALADAEFGIAPTRWQGSRFPAEMQRKIAIIHEGIDTDAIQPMPTARVTLPNSGVELKAGDEVITFVNRNLEPYRGYHIFMRALPEILAARPNAHAVIVGGDAVSYGPAAPRGKSWAGIFRDEVSARLPPERVHFTGRVPYPLFLDLLRVSAVHVYLTYPFVLSWSLLEAMSAGALVVGSKTPPVEDVISHERNGFLVDFFDHESLAAAVAECLGNPHRYIGLRRAARQTIVKRFDLRRVCLPQWMQFVMTVGGKKRSPTGARTSPG